MSSETPTFSRRIQLIGHLEGAAFWTAVALAFSYPVVLIGLDRGWIDAVVFFGIVAAHVVALIAGHGYRPP